MTRPRHMSTSAVLIFTTVLLVLGYAAFGPRTHKVFAQGIQPVGSYGFRIEGAAVPPASPNAAIGVISFDGAGGVSGSFTSYDPSSSPPVLTGTFTGTYSTNADGTGSFAIVTGDGQNQQWAMVMAHSNSQISLLRTDLLSGNGLLSGVATKQ